MNVENIVSGVKCESYGEFYSSLALALQPLGGMKNFVKNGDLVAIKPNCIRAIKPDMGATTHPEAMRAVIRMVKECGGKPIIVESPGGPSVKTFVKSVFNATGIAQIAAQEEVELCYDSTTVNVEVENPYILRKVDVLKKLKEADVIINVAKPKPHGMMVYTGAVKNMFGAINGTSKVNFHMKHADYNRFAEALIDIYNSVKPVLNILDGVITMHESGPTSGKPFDAKFILAGVNAFKLDLAALEVVGADPDAVFVMKKAKSEGLISDINNVDIYVNGEECADLDDLKVKNFVLPTDLSKQKRSFIVKALTSLGVVIKPRPKFVPRKCKKCGICVKSCPAKCLDLSKDASVPQIDLNKCIRCFCCEELCPENAVKIKRF